MKNRHNKRKNTNFLYEVLLRELSKCLLKEDTKNKDIILSLLRKHFKKNTVLGRELELYRILSETKGMEEKLAMRLIDEVKKVYFNFGKEEIGIAQTSLMDDIKKTLHTDVMYNHVPNYRDLATIYQLFNRKLSPDKRVILENQICNSMISLREEKKEVEKVDKATIKVFMNKFNDTYSTSLLKEQQELLNRFIVSKPYEQTELKIFLNEELGRLKSMVNKTISETEERELKIKLHEVRTILEGFKEIPHIEDTMVEQLMRIQQLVKEIS